MSFQREQGQGPKGCLSCCLCAAACAFCCSIDAEISTLVIDERRRALVALGPGLESTDAGTGLRSSEYRRAGDMVPGVFSGFDEDSFLACKPSPLSTDSTGVGV